MISNMVDTVELGQKEEILVNASLIKRTGVTQS